MAFRKFSWHSRTSADYAEESQLRCPRRIRVIANWVGPHSDP